MKYRLLLIVSVLTACRGGLSATSPVFAQSTPLRAGGASTSPTVTPDSWCLRVPGGCHRRIGRVYCFKEVYTEAADNPSI